MYSNYWLLIALSVIILLPILILLVQAGNQKKDEINLEKLREKLADDNCKKFLFNIAATVKWRIVLISSLVIAGFSSIFITTLISVIYPCLTCCELGLLFLFIFIFILFFSFMTCNTLLGYYNYHYLTVQPEHV